MSETWDDIGYNSTPSKGWKLIAPKETWEPYIVPPAETVKECLAKAREAISGANKTVTK